jgi:hypothetical protein
MPMRAVIGKTFKAIGRLFARKLVRRAAMICVLFGLMVGGGVYMARHATSLFGSSAPPPPPELAARSDNITGSASMKDDDPVKNFARTGVGHVLFTGSGTDACKRTLFDNKTGSYRIVDDINCGNGGEVDDKKSEQLNSMRKAFNR